MDIYFVHRIDHTNIGDLYCTPWRYYEFPGCRKIPIDIANYEDLVMIPKNSKIIFGGGGLLDNNNFTNRHINYLLNKSNNVIGWGLGFNIEHELIKPENKLQFSKFKRLKIRNKIDGFEFCPCVSCKYFENLNYDKPYKTLGIYSHKNFRIPNESNEDYLTNDSKMSDVVSFIQEHEKILTNSFHGIYWSTLLGRFVYTYQHFNRFDNTEFDKFILKNSDSLEFMNYDQVEFLQKCIKLNDDYYKEIVELWNLH